MNTWLLVLAAGAVALPLAALLRAAFLSDPEPGPRDLVQFLDEPIRSRSQDALGRVAMVDALASELREALPGQSLVYAIAGNWGSGKTSFLNMLSESLEQDPARVVIRFNPWLFAHAEQLLTHFFREVASQLRLKLPNESAAANQMLNYADVLSPLVWVPGLGAWFGRASQALALAGKRRERAAASTSVEATRDALIAALSRLTQPIFVFIDDVDRLDGGEVREVLRLVRLVAHLPNVVHVLAFDERQVVRAIDADEASGAAYLEKIVQRTVPLPYPSDDRLAEMTLEALESALAGKDTGPLQSDRWPDVFAEIVLPQLRTVRDVKRYVAAAAATATAVGGDVALADLLALEAVRLFMPLAYGYLQSSPASFAGAAAEIGLATSSDNHDSVVTRFLNAGAGSSVPRAVCERLFPKTLAQLGGSHYGSTWLGQWRKDLRVAHPDILGFYLRREVTPALAATRASRLLAPALQAGDDQLFEQILSSVPLDSLEDVVESLEAYEGDFDATSAATGVPALSKLFGTLPRRFQGLFQLDADLKISRVVLRLLRADPDEGHRLQTIEAALQGASIFGRYELVNLVGHRENVGHALVGHEQAAALEARLREQVLAASPDLLAGDNVLTVLFWTFRTGDQGEREDVVRRAFEPPVAEAILLDAVTDVRSQTMGSRSVRSEPRLAWEPLLDVVGGEDGLRELILRVSAEMVPNEALQAAISMAERYLAGWRPDRG